jgi:hypothetical protein
MNISEMTRLLREMYDDPTTDKAVSIHLFGIKFASELDGMPLKEILVKAELPVSYVTEINKGRNLAKYVTLK